MQRVFRASWDIWVWVITSFFILLMGVFPLGLISFALTTPGANRTILIGIGVVLLIMLAVTYLFSPQAYQLESGVLTIQRPGTDVTIPLGMIERVEVCGGWQVFRGALRLGASGGAFGFYGSFWSKGLKNFSAFATRLDRVVILYRTQGDPIILSPDEVEAFVQVVEWARRRG